MDAGIAIGCRLPTPDVQPPHHVFDFVTKRHRSRLHTKPVLFRIQRHILRHIDRPVDQDLAQIAAEHGFRPDDQLHAGMLRDGLLAQLPIPQENLAITLRVELEDRVKRALNQGHSQRLSRRRRPAGMTLLIDPIGNHRHDHQRGR